jgi:hypothetical protein
LGNRHKEERKTMEIFTPLSFWIQLASFFFTMAGIHADLMVIRFFLVMSYLMLFLNSILGSPLWPNARSSGGIFVDSLVWSIINLYVHGSSLICLILDERHTSFTDDEAALWRMFYRTGGLSGKLFKTIIAPHLEVVEFEAGENIPTEDYFYIVYTGRITLQVYEMGQIKVERKTLSGEMFDLKYLGMFSEESVFEIHRLNCTSETKSKLFRFSREDMKKIAHHRLAKGVWQSLLINNLSFVVESYLEIDRHSKFAESYCDKIFDPLEDWEMPKKWVAGSGSAMKNPELHLLQYIRHSFSPPWPFGGHLTGLRQTLLSPPPQRPSPLPQLPPLFHRMASSLTIANLNRSATPTHTLPEDQVEAGHGARAPDQEQVE